MKQSLRQALRLPAIVVLSIVAVLIVSLGTQARPAHSQAVRFSVEQFGLQGVHHRLGRELVNAKGRRIVIDDIVVAQGKIAVRYHADGLSTIPFNAIQSNSLYKMEPPTLIVIKANGTALKPFDGTTSGEDGGSIIAGEFVAQFSGPSPRQIHIAVVRIRGDRGATWETDADL